MKKLGKALVIVAIVAGALVAVKLCLEVFGSSLKKYIKIDEMRGI